LFGLQRPLGYDLFPTRHNLKAVLASDRRLDCSAAVKTMMAAAADLQHKGYKLGQLAPSSKN
jgi:hypothetical protein